MRNAVFVLASRMRCDSEAAVVFMYAAPSLPQVGIIQFLPSVGLKGVPVPDLLISKGSATGSRFDFLQLQKDSIGDPELHQTEGATSSKKRWNRFQEPPHTVCSCVVRVSDKNVILIQCG